MTTDTKILLILLSGIIIRFLFIIKPNIDIAYGEGKGYRILLFYNDFTEKERKYIILYTHKQK